MRSDWKVILHYTGKIVIGEAIIMLLPIEGYRIGCHRVRAAGNTLTSTDAA